MRATDGLDSMGQQIDKEDVKNDHGFKEAREKEDVAEKD